ECSFQCLEMLSQHLDRTTASYACPRVREPGPFENPDILCVPIQLCLARHPFGKIQTRGIAISSSQAQERVDPDRSTPGRQAHLGQKDICMIELGTLASEIAVAEGVKFDQFFFRDHGMSLLREHG